LAQSGEVVWSAISLVRGETVHRENRIPGGDHAVAFHLGENGSGGDGGRERVAVNDGLLGKGAIEFDGINEKIVGSGCEFLNRMQHGEARGLIDIDLIDAGGIYRSHRPGDGVMANEPRELFAALGRKQLGIAQAANAMCRVEDDSRGNDWAKERSAANFIDSGKVERALGPSALFEFEGAAKLVQKAQLDCGGRQALGLGGFGFRA